MEDSEEEEEYLVHVEFEGMLDTNILNRPNLFFKMIGLDTDKPVMQIEEQVYMGEYRDTVGTALFFEEDSSPPAHDPVFSNNSNMRLRYVCKTRKSLLMSRVFLKKKEEWERETQEKETEVPEKNVVLGEAAPDVTNAKEDLFISKMSDMSMLPTSPSITQEGNKMQETFEPIPGPSWAPDIPQSEFVGLVQDSRSQKAVSADDMSRLIAEQMTIASDINMQNMLSDSDDLSD